MSRGVVLTAILVFVIAIALLVIGCTKQEKPAPVLMTPTSRLLYHDGTHGLWTQCDKQNLIYMTTSGAFQVVPGGCPGGQP